MPIHEYKCENCGKVFEILQKVNEEPLSECILCHNGPVKKLISVSSFVLKGPGFYVNDYPSASRGQAAKKEKTFSGAPTSSSTASTSESSSASTKTEPGKKAD